MVRTWDAAWFGEDGQRLLYLVPRKQTDELLPLAIDPKPTEIVRVLVGRHDFLTPEQEADVDRAVGRSRSGRVSTEAVERELAWVGRFAAETRAMSEQRLRTRAAPR